MKYFKKYPWLLFVCGLALGILAIGFYDYYLNHRPNFRQPEEAVTRPVSFSIGPYSHILGDYDAAVTLVVFNDFSCPYCQEHAQNLEKLLTDYSQQLRIVWKHFPLNQLDLSPAISSECADEQGKFWDYAHGLYTNQNNFDDDFYLSLARSLKLDLSQFKNCLKSDKYKAKIQADYYEGIAKGVLGSPATFINGQYIAGVIPPERLAEIINQLL